MQNSKACSEVILIKSCVSSFVAVTIPNLFEALEKSTNGLAAAFQPENLSSPGGITDFALLRKFCPRIHDPESLFTEAIPAWQTRVISSTNVEAVNWFTFLRFLMTGRTRTSFQMVASPGGQ